MYIEIILPVPFSNTFTYFVPPEMEAHVMTGSLVRVSFGKTKQYSGIVSHIRQTPPEITSIIKPILAVESIRPAIRRLQLRLWEWISTYYLCKLGEVYKAVLPSGFRSETAGAYSERKETYVRLTSLYSIDENLPNAFEKVKRAVKQEHLLLTFIQFAQSPETFAKEIPKKELLRISNSGEAALNGLREKGILQIYEKTISRLKTYSKELKPLHILNILQQQAYNEIISSFRQKDVCLLHGVTSSGKTEIYTHLIQETLKLKRQVLYLLPEIALTNHITDRLKHFFGDKLGVYHSKINTNERVEIWNNLLGDDGFQIILGVRSSIFLPFNDLGLIIVDEEHDSSYKQQDPAPRYNARNAAIMLATMHGAKVVLGSATPSMESFYNAQTGKYGYVELKKRFEATELPHIVPVDVKELRRKKKMKTIFSPLLIERMQETLDKGEQILLFQNRRGFAPGVVCKICEWTPKCRFCDISLSYHKKNNQLSCHYCGRTYQMPAKCPECGTYNLETVGYGTEKVEEEIKKLFPQIPVDRMDTDTAKTNKSFQEIISKFEAGETRILIGTQMISKGLDFDKVNLTGIINADALMNYPDFRAYERAYQLMSQVAGRTGRRKTQGEVILQTSHPEHPLIQMVLQHDYKGMYNMQMEERELFKYPPLFRLINIIFKHKKEEILRNMTQEYACLLREKLGNRVMGPDKPAVSKIQNLHIKKILLKIEHNASLSALRDILEQTQSQILSNPAFRYVLIQYDVDPV
ncbi:MAG: primosomal protein N' [Dysgonamonadaceae bacterium]|jgi:primosomal protein N' (replication factor Y)|nr:primosomal protein N' [Dysgonamonadaceae bacterium]